MKNFLILLLALVCLLLFYSLKVKSQKLAEQEATISDLTSKLEEGKGSRGGAEYAEREKMKQAAARVAAVTPVPTPPVVALVVPPVTPAPVAVQTPVVAAVLPAQARETALGEFARVMKTDITTSAPPFVIFMDEVKSSRGDAEGAEGERPQGGDMVRKLGIDRYNGFMMHLFPGRPDLRMVAPAPGEPENATSSQVNLSPAKLLWVAVDDASPDAKYAVRWLKVNSPQLKVTQDAMLALDGQIGGSAAPGADAGGAALVRCLHDAQESLKTMLNGRPPVVEDQRRVAFFLRTAGVGR